MNRRTFLRNLAVGAFLPYLDLMAGPAAGKVKITNVFIKA